MMTVANVAASAEERFFVDVALFEALTRFADDGVRLKGSTAQWVTARANRPVGDHQVAAAIGQWLRMYRHPISLLLEFRAGLLDGVPVTDSDIEAVAGTSASIVEALESRLSRLRTRS